MKYLLCNAGPFLGLESIKFPVIVNGVPRRVIGKTDIVIQVKASDLLMLGADPKYIRVGHNLEFYLYDEIKEIDETVTTDKEINNE